MKAACSGCSCAVARRAPRSWSARRRRGRPRARGSCSPARPSISTVHAPHWPWSQPFFAPGEAEVLAQQVEQRGAGVDGQRVLGAVDGERDVGVHGRQATPRVLPAIALATKRWLVDDLSPGEAEGSEPQHREDARRGGGPLRRPAASGGWLGRRSRRSTLLRAPEEVDFVGTDDRVDLGPRQLRIEDEGEEPLLELGAGDVRLRCLQRSSAARSFLVGRPWARANCALRERVSRRRRCSARWTTRSVWWGVRVEVRSTRVRATVVRGRRSTVVRSSGLQPSVHSDLRRGSCVGEGADVELRG